MSIAGVGMASHANVLVRNFPREMNQGVLLSMFRPFGLIMGYRVFSTASTPFAYLKLDSVENAHTAIQALNNQVVEGKTLVVKSADTDAEYETPNANLYVINVPVEWTDQTMADLFKPYGVVVSTKVLPQVVSASGKCALVRMATPEEAHAAKQALNVQIPGANAYPLVVKYADTANDKQRKRDNSARAKDRFTPYPNAQSHGMDAKALEHMDPAQISMMFNSGGAGLEPAIVAAAANIIAGQDRKWLSYPNANHLGPKDGSLNALPAPRNPILSGQLVPGAGAPGHGQQQHMTQEQQYAAWYSHMSGGDPNMGQPGQYGAPPVQYGAPPAMPPNQDQYAQYYGANPGQMPPPGQYAPPPSQAPAPEGSWAQHGMAPQGAPYNQYAQGYQQPAPMQPYGPGPTQPPAGNAYPSFPGGAPPAGAAPPGPYDHYAPPAHAPAYGQAPPMAQGGGAPKGPGPAPWQPIAANGPPKMGGPQGGPPQGGPPKGPTNGAPQAAQPGTGQVAQVWDARSAMAANSALSGPKAVVVTGLPSNIDRLGLYEHFASFGGLVHASMPMNGTAWITFTDPATAVKAAKAKHGSRIGDCTLGVSPQHPPGGLM